MASLFVYITLYFNMFFIKNKTKYHFSLYFTLKLNLIFMKIDFYLYTCVSFRCQKPLTFVSYVIEFPLEKMHDATSPLREVRVLLRQDNSSQQQYTNYLYALHGTSDVLVSVRASFIPKTWEFSGATDNIINGFTTASCGVHHCYTYHMFQTYICYWHKDSLIVYKCLFLKKLAMFAD